MGATVASLKPGERGIIKEFSNTLPPIKLLEMGCLPGNEVVLLQEAPLKDPLYIVVNGSHIAIRRSLAQLIELEIIHDSSPL